MGRQHSHHRRSCPIDILSNDALMPIFSYLPILDKIKAVRVCQKWKYLLRHPSVWRTINISQLNKYLKPMTYIGKQTAVLQFLKEYAGPSTKQVWLQNLASSEVLRFLTTTCTALEGVALFLHEQCDLALLPDSLTYIDLRLPITGGSGTAVDTFPEKPFRHLQHLNLHGVQITNALCSSLMHSKKIRYLTLFHCAFHSQYGREFVTLMQELKWISKLVLAYCWFSSMEQLEEILNNIATNCKLQSFDLRFPYVPCDAEDHEIAHLNLDSFLKSSVHMDTLISLNFSGINGMMSEGFAMFLQQHNNLETLDLSSCRYVDDDILYKIATHLTKLKSLQLRWCDNITNVGLLSLAHHPNLQTLNLAIDNITGKAVLKTVITFPKIRHLSLSKVHGYQKCALTLKLHRPELSIIII